MAIWVRLGFCPRGADDGDCGGFARGGEPGGGDSANPRIRRQLDRGLRPPLRFGLRSAAPGRSPPQRRTRRGDQWRGLGRHGGSRPGAAGLDARRNGREAGPGHRRFGWQRYASGPSADAHPRGFGGDRRRAEEEGHQVRGGGDAGGAQSRAGLWVQLQRHLSRAGAQARGAALPLLPVGRGGGFEAVAGGSDPSQLPGDQADGNGDRAYGDRGAGASLIVIPAEAGISSLLP